MTKTTNLRSYVFPMVGLGFTGRLRKDKEIILRLNYECFFFNISQFYVKMANW